MTGTFGLLLDLLLLGLLSATIWFAVRLNRSLTTVRDGKAELGQLLLSLGSSVERAEAVLAELRAQAGDQERGLARRVGDAARIAEELELLCVRAERAVTTMDQPPPPAARTAKPSGAAAAPESPRVQDELAAAVEQLRRGAAKGGRV